MVKIVTTNIKFNFECQFCNACCVDENKTRVEVTPFDVNNISKHLKIKPKEFLTQYCHKKETKNVPFFFLQFPCKFLKEKCTIYEIRPMGCRTFPIGIAKILQDNKLHLRYTLNTCPGYGKGKETCLDNFLKKEEKREKFDLIWIPLKKELHQRIAKNKFNSTKYEKLFLLEPDKCLKKAKKLL